MLQQTGSALAPRRSTPTAALHATAGSSRPSMRPAISKRPAAGASRWRAVACRADVNSDAFRPAYEHPARSAHGSPVRQYDYLVLGSGIAGLSYALKVAEYGRVAVITKDYANEGCTQYAQGGVCAVLDACDSVDSHMEDTMVAGAFLNDRK